MSVADKYLQALRTIIEGLEKEQSVSMQDSKPMPLPDRESRSHRLDEALKHLKQGLAVLESESSQPPDVTPSLTTLRDGRYNGGNDQLYVELRVDEDVSGVISADLYRIGLEGRSYVASIRTTPGERISRGAGAWNIIGQDETGTRTTGTLTLQAQETSPPSIMGRIRFASALHGLPSRADITFTANWQSEYMRSLGLEIEIEKNVNQPAPFDFKGQTVTIESCFQDAGLELTDVGLSSQIPVRERGWGTAELHALMQDFAEAPLTRRAWEIHLLVLAKSTRAKLLGIMFDETEQLPRQGVAIFAETIRKLQADDPDRKLIQTIVHEVGHALNLAHRFERVVGRANSTSFMNYDWRYKGGGRRREFWSRFKFLFDSDELEFLRHAPLPAIIPGGSAFHSINYWADGNGGYTPYFPPEKPLTGYRLVLTPPRGGPILAFGQPVFLQIELFNESDSDLEVPSFILDQKSDLLELIVRRRNGNASTSPMHGELFVPVLQRCFDLDTTAIDIIPPGKSKKNNINLTYGSGGFAFAEPGQYEVTAAIVMFRRNSLDPNKTDEFVVYSNTLRIQVATPKTIQEEKDALVLFRDDVGLYFALGGTDQLHTAHNALEEIRAERQGKAKRVTDPIVSNIVRCQGINIGRSFARYIDGRFKERPDDREKAAKLLGSLGKRALEAFDDHTAESTKSLAQKHLEAVEAKKGH